jgi:nitroreductase
MDFFDLVNKRRSVRKFSNEKVPEEVILKSLRAALLAANSSNLQPWEFYWVKNKNKKEELVKACFSQNAAKTAQELIVAVSRIDTWRRNRDLVLEDYKNKEKLLPIIEKYYNKAVPFSYFHDFFGISGIIKKIISFFINIIGLFKPMPRGPIFKHDVFEIVTKTTALACQNFMMALVSQGYDSCPMEGFDHKRVKKIINLNNKSHVVMVLGVGKADPKGIYGERFRINEDLVIKII